MLCVVLLSVSTAFAVSDNATVVDDETITEESVLAIEEDSDALEATGEVSLEAPAANVVTNDTFFNYFDANGSLLSNVTSEELEFDGDFSGISVSTITINKPIKFTGKNATFNGVSLSVNASGVVIDGFAFTQNNSEYLIKVNQVNNVTLSNNLLTYQAMADKDGYAVFANAVNNLKFINNAINYAGNTSGTNVNNAVLVSESENVLFEDNEFLISIPSVYVYWQEIPAGSGNWVSSPLSEGIVVKSTRKVSFINNVVELEYNGVFGLFDTIYAIDLNDVDDPVVYENTIKALGHSYIHGIIVSGDNFNITNNKITAVSDFKYANGIDVEGPATGVINNNIISAKGSESAYGIYSGMNGKNASVDYRDNIIDVSAYFAMGMSLGDLESRIYNNIIIAEGNYTMGIASQAKYLWAVENEIVLNSSEQGNETVTDLFGCESNGVKVMGGYNVLYDNLIETAGCGFKAIDGEATLSGNVINVTGNVDKDAYAIYAIDVFELLVTRNNVSYVGKTKGNGINNAVYVNNANSADILENAFNLSLVSAYVPWSEVPAGSGKWVAFPISEGIVVDLSDNVAFNDNNVTVTCADVVGIQDTIYSLSFKESNNATIKNNNIAALGNTYVYAIMISGDDFAIDGNTISTQSVNYYANGIDIEGPASGAVENNVIDVKGIVSAYAIYSGMNGAEVTVNYAGNNITGSAYNAFGMSLGDVESHISGNFIDLNGNYTTGIAYYGDHIEVKDNNIILNSSQQGNESIWESFGVESVGVKVKKGSLSLVNNTIYTAGKGVSLVGNETSAYLEDNFINVVANNDKDAYAIYAVELPSLKVLNNDIDYQGATAGNGLNNALYIFDVGTSQIAANKFDLELVSTYVPWFEIPAGSGKWVAFPVSEGIVVEQSDNVILSDNVINVTYGDVSGIYDTIYVVSFKDSDSAFITGNNITASGHTYIYGIQISGNDFIINENMIQVNSDNYYANGIDVEGPASGEISENVFSVTGVESAYAIYSNMNGENVSTTYTDNIIIAKAYNAFGMSLGDVECAVELNEINLEGNYTTGIAYYGSKLMVNDNSISALGSGVGNLSVWDAFGVENIGIKVAAGESTITNNDIITSGYYAVDVRNNNASVHDNYLIGKKFVGDESVNNAAYSEVYNNTPVINESEKVVTAIVIKEASGNMTVSGVLTANGIPLKDEITFSIGNLTGTVETDENGTFIIYDVANNELLTLTYAEDSYRQSSNATFILRDVANYRAATVINSEDYSTYAIDVNAGERGGYFKVQLVDKDGNPLANKSVKIGFNGVVYNKTTDENGWAQLQINLAKEGEYTFAIAFLGDENYEASFVVQKITVIKKNTYISASEKTFKASAKTKSYTVTLKTDAGSSIDGKAYLKSGKKITLKINGKTYSAKTNSKGQATFKLSITKKGKFATSIKFAGDNTYLASSKSVKISIK